MAEYEIDLNPKKLLAILVLITTLSLAYTTFLHTESSDERSTANSKQPKWIYGYQLVQINDIPIVTQTWTVQSQDGSVKEKIDILVEYSLIYKQEETNAYIIYTSMSFPTGYHADMFFDEGVNVVYNNSNNQNTIRQIKNITQDSARGSYFEIRDNNNSIITKQRIELIRNVIEPPGNGLSMEQLDNITKIF